MMSFSQRLHPFWVYFFAIVICLAVGALGGYVTAGSVETWYLTVNKPTFNPPSWVFGPVWTTLYILMAIAWARVLTCRTVSDHDRAEANRLFILQLILNGIWSFIFFGLHAISFAFIDLLALWVVLWVTLIKFMKISRLAGWLLVPYCSSLSIQVKAR